MRSPSGQKDLKGGHLNWVQPASSQLIYKKWLQVTNNSMEHTFTVNVHFNEWGWCFNLQIFLRFNYTMFEKLHTKSTLTSWKCCQMTKKLTWIPKTRSCGECMMGHFAQRVHIILVPVHLCKCISKALRNSALKMIRINCVQPWSCRPFCLGFNLSSFC